MHFRAFSTLKILQQRQQQQRHDERQPSLKILYKKEKFCSQFLPIWVECTE